MTSRLVDAALVGWCCMCAFWLSDLSTGVPWWGWAGSAVLAAGVLGHVFSNRYTLGR